MIKATKKLNNCAMPKLWVALLMCLVLVGTSNGEFLEIEETEDTQDQAVAIQSGIAYPIGQWRNDCSSSRMHLATDPEMQTMSCASDKSAWRPGDARTGKFLVATCYNKQTGNDNYVTSCLNYDACPNKEVSTLYGYLGCATNAPPYSGPSGLPGGSWELTCKDAKLYNVGGMNALAATCMNLQQEPIFSSSYINGCVNAVLTNYNGQLVCESAITKADTDKEDVAVAPPVTQPQVPTVAEAGPCECDASAGFSYHGACPAATRPLSCAELKSNFATVCEAPAGKSYWAGIQDQVAANAKNLQSMTTQLEELESQVKKLTADATGILTSDTLATGLASITVPSQCNGGNLQFNQFCYKPCKSGYSQNGEYCYNRCPEGSQDFGTSCHRSRDEYDLASENKCPEWDRCGLMQGASVLSSFEGCGLCKEGYTKDVKGSSCKCVRPADSINKVGYKNEKVGPLLCDPAKEVPTQDGKGCMPKSSSVLKPVADFKLAQSQKIMADQIIPLRAQIRDARAKDTDANTKNMGFTASGPSGTCALMPEIAQFVGCQFKDSFDAGMNYVDSKACCTCKGEPRQVFGEFGQPITLSQAVFPAAPTLPHPNCKSTCAGNKACDYLAAACNKLAPVIGGFRLTTEMAGPGKTQLAGSIAVGIVSVPFGPMPMPSATAGGIAFTPAPALSVSLGDIVGAVADSRLKMAGLDDLRFTFQTAGVTTSTTDQAQAKEDTTVHFAGQVGVHGATVAAEVYFMPATKQFAIGIDAASGAQGVFNALYNKITGRKDELFNINTLQVAYSSKGFQVPFGSAMASTTGQQFVARGGLQVNTEFSLSTSGKNGFLKVLSALTKGQSRMALTYPADGPVRVALSLASVRLGQSTLSSLSLQMVLPSPSVSTAAAVAPAQCRVGETAALPPGAFGLAFTANFNTMLGGQGVVLQAAVVAALDSPDTGSAALCLSYQGTIRNVFGWKQLILSDLSGSLMLTTTAPYAHSGSLAGTVSIGGWSASMAATLDLQDATKRSMFVQLNNGLTVGQLAGAVFGATLPAFLGDTGFGPGSYFAYAGSDMTINSGGQTFDLRQGLQAQGSFNLLGGKANFAVTFASSSDQKPRQMSIAITPNPTLSFQLSKLLGALGDDKRVSHLGLDTVTFGLSSLAVVVTDSDTTIHVAGQVSLYGVMVTAEVYFVSSTKAIAISIIASQAAQAAFNGMFQKITGMSDSPFSVETLSLAFSTPQFNAVAATSSALGPAFASATGVAYVPGGGVELVSRASLSADSSSKVLNMIAKMLGSGKPNTLTLTFPATGPITVKLGLPSVKVGRSELADNALLLSLPSPTATEASTPPLSAAQSCSALSANALGVVLSTNFNTKLGGQPVTFAGSLSAALGGPAVSFKMCLSYSGVIKQAFGWKKLTLSGLSGSLTLMTAPPVFQGASLSATIAIGQTWSTTLAASIDLLDPTRDSFYVSLNDGLTLGQLAGAVFGGEMPAYLSQSGFGPGSYFAFAGSAITVPQGTGTVQLVPGLSSAGSINLFGVKATYAVAFQSAHDGLPAQFAIALDLSPLHFGTVGVYADATKQSGPSFSFTSNPIALTGNAYVEAWLFSAAVAVKANTNGLTFSTAVSIWKLDAEATVKIDTKKKTASFTASVGIESAFSTSGMMNWAAKLGKLFKPLNERQLKWCKKLRITGICDKYTHFQESLIEEPVKHHKFTSVAFSLEIAGELTKKSASLSLTFYFRLGGLHFSFKLELTPQGLAHALGGAVKAIAEAVKKAVIDFIEDKIEEALKKLGDKVEKVADKVKDKIGDGLEKIGDKLKRL